MYVCVCVCVRVCVCACVCCVCVQKHEHTHTHTHHFSIHTTHTYERTKKNTTNNKKQQKIIKESRILRFWDCEKGAKKKRVATLAISHVWRVCAR